MPRGNRRGFRNGVDRGPDFGCGCGRDHRGHGMGYGRVAAGRGRGAYDAPAFEDEREDFNSEEKRDREITRLENLANTLSSELEIVKNKINKLKYN